jgi:ribosomal protein S12 methylthiotransferase accessory factor
LIGGSEVADPESSLSIRLQSAAASLTDASVDPKTVNLLRYFGYDNGDADAAPARARMLRAAAVFRRVFRWPTPDAPGLVFFGGEADPAILGPHNTGLPIGGIAGSGLEPQRAFESCVGEGIEYLSQFARPGDKLVPGPIDRLGEMLDPESQRFIAAVFSACGVLADHAVSWVSVRRMLDGAACWYPADLCLRRAAPDFAPPMKLSTGCAAGMTREAATLHGLLELIERDAVALWWRGGRRGRTVPPDSKAGVAAEALLVQVRQGRSDRRTCLLDITTDLGIPAVAAFSLRKDGYGFALGLGAGTSLREAARSAIFEMCQSELSLHVIEAKRRESGDAALNESDLRQHARAALLDTRTCLLLQPGGGVAEEPAAFTGDPVEAITRQLDDRGIVAYSLDLTRPEFDVPVVRVIAPGLQNEPCAIASGRLARAIAETGGGAKYSGGVALL